MFILYKSIHWTIILQTDTEVSVNDLLDRTKRVYHKLVSKLKISCGKLNLAKDSSYIKSLDWSRYKKASINSKATVIGFFCIISHLRRTIKKSKIIMREYQIFKYILICVTGKVQNSVNENDYILFEKNNPETALTVLYVDAGVDVFQYDEYRICIEYARVHKSIKQSYLSKYYLYYLYYYLSIYLCYH